MGRRTRPERRRVYKTVRHGRRITDEAAVLGGGRVGSGVRVARGRYLQQRGTNTEVLDAEAARVQSYDNYFNAVYDAIVAGFDLRRAVGDI